MKIAHCLVFAWLGCICLFGQCLAEPLGMEELVRLDRLPVFRTSVKIGAISSYDRTGGNDDGFSGGFESGKTLFFEGDDQTTIDGELVIHGTGSEDFFNGGWYDVPDCWEKRLAFPLSGCLGYAKHLGRTGAYRFFLGDAYAYRQHLRQTIEHAGEKNSVPTDYCSVTYLYSERRPTANLAPPPLQKRAVNDLQEVVFPAWWQTPKPSKSGRVLLGRLDLDEGRNNLMIKLVGKNERSSGLGLDLISVICLREP